MDHWWWCRRWSDPTLSRGWAHQAKQTLSDLHYRHSHRNATKQESKVTITTLSFVILKEVTQAHIARFCGRLFKGFCVFDWLADTSLKWPAPFVSSMQYCGAVISIIWCCPIKKRFSRRDGLHNVFLRLPKFRFT